MPRRSEEPEWDTDDGSEGSGSEGSEFDDEGSDEGSSNSSESGSDQDSEEGSSDDESGSGSGSDSNSDDSDESSEGSDDMEEVGFGDEGGKGLSNGNLMNEPDAEPKWSKVVPAKIMAYGLSAALIFCICIFLIPLILIIGLSVGLTRGKDDNNPKVLPTPVPVPTAPPVAAVTPQPTFSPTAAPLIEEPLITSEISTTIYRDGILAEVSQGEETTMLVQNGPSGDTELPSAYALVDFDGIVGLDSGITSVDDYLKNIQDLTVPFCLTVAGNDAEDPITYQTCLLPADSAPGAVDGLTGVSAPAYGIPGDCLNDKSVTFVVDSKTTEVCVDVASLLTATSDEDVPEGNATVTNATDTESTEPDPTRSLRGSRRALQGSEANITYLFMIDSLEESDQPGTEFYSSKDESGRGPSLRIQGKNTCRSAVSVACSDPNFKFLCDAVKTAGLEDVLDSKTSPKTLFAPTTAAFSLLGDDFVSNNDELINVLQYHLVNNKIMSTDLTCNAPVDMMNSEQTTTLCGMNGADKQFYQVGTGVSPGVSSFPKIVSPDIETCFGVIHVVDQVLVPPSPNTTCIPGEEDEEEALSIAELCQQSEFATFCGLLEAAGIANIFSNGLYTLFVPSDEAVNTTMASMDDAPSAEAVTDIILQHIISGSALFEKDFDCNDEVVMASGDANKLKCKDDEVTITGPGNDKDMPPKVIKTDTVGCNFVIHRIDGVILPDTSVDTPEGDGDGGSDEDGEYPSCGICGEDMMITDLNAKIEIPDSVGLPAEFGDVTCAMADSFCQSGACSPDTCTSFDEGVKESCGCEKSLNIGDYLVDQGDKYSTLLDFAMIAGVLDDLKETPDITLFLPTNKAFDGLVEKASDLLSNLKDKDEWKTHLTNLLLYHVVPGRYLSSDITNDEKRIEAINEEDVIVRINNSDKLLVNEVKIEKVDINAENGIIHTIQDVLLPSWVNNNIIDIVEDNTDLSAIYEFIKQAELIDVLSGDGPLTIFAPTNGAVQKSLDSLEGVGLDDEDTIATILTYHVVEGIHPASAISDGLGLTTIEGKDIIFTLTEDTAKVNGNEILSTDILANNGIIHLIDGVLVPPDLLVEAASNEDSSASKSSDENASKSNDEDETKSNDEGTSKSNDEGESNGIPLTNIPDIFDPGFSQKPSIDGETQACSICSGKGESFRFENAEAMVKIPNGISIQNIDGTEATCTLLEQACSLGFCDDAACIALAASDTKATCGCVKNERS